MSVSAAPEIGSVVVIAPHADDEVIGAGGLIASFAGRGTRVYVQYVAVDTFHHYGLEGPATLEQRRREIGEVAGLLGFQYSVVYEGRDLTERLDTLPQRDLVQTFESVIEEHKPDLLLLPHGVDYDQDHRAVFDAAFAAARPIPANCGKHTPRRVATYESPKLAWMEAPFKPTLYLDVTSQLERKLQALRAYRTQLREPPHVRSPENLAALARLRGSESGVPFAEAFHILRWCLD